MIVMINRATKSTLTRLKILFQVSKIRKKGYIEMIENFYIETWKSVLGSSIYHYYWMLRQPVNKVRVA